MWDWLFLRHIGQLNVGLANCKTESDIERGIAKNSLMVSTTV